ncbi:MAG TPA: hypothetical protein VMI72_17045 [Roseiarcus sp.]|nr:hypothetical protein [Roseiarcus sp.]
MDIVHCRRVEPEGTLAGRGWKKPTPRRLRGQESQGVDSRSGKDALGVAASQRRDPNGVAPAPKSNPSRQFSGFFQWPSPVERFDVVTFPFKNDLVTHQLFIMSHL